MSHPAIGRSLLGESEYASMLGMLSPGQQEALAWIRSHVPEEAIVQMEPVVRGRDQWSLIPTFAGRRMAAGMPISLSAPAELGH